MTRRRLISAVGQAWGLFIVALVFGGLFLAWPVGSGSAERLSPNWVCYSIAGHVPNVTVTVNDQFDEADDVKVLWAYRLCAPAKKDSEGNLDDPHLKCYKIKDASKPPPTPVRLSTQFGIEPEVLLDAADRLCVPALKKVISPTPKAYPPGDVPNEPFYKCHPIALGAKNPPNTVHLEDQFVPSRDKVPVGWAEWLCTAAEVDGRGSFFVPDLKCYGIPDKEVPHKVDLKSYFGIEQDVDVSYSKELCVPVDKTVGGIVELLVDSSSSPARPAEASGSSSPPYAALAGAAAAGALAVTAGAWYARRRLS